MGLIITILLNALCQGGMGIISWIIVFIPFIFMSVIVVILLYVFGLDPATGKVKVECSNCPNKQQSGNLIFISFLVAIFICLMVVFNVKGEKFC